jgi:P pilus assembly chaperone PapD
MSTSKPWLAVAAAACALAGAVPAQASTVIAGTRVIYPQREREVTVRVSNQGDAPALVQAWIDDGDAKADPATIKVPFTLTPPMFRVDPDKGQTLRIMYTQQPLPADKESVFWLNTLEVQPRPKDADGKNLLQFAFRTRIKIFFRPDGLAGKPEGAAAKLQWSLVTSGAGKALRVTNPGAYHVSFRFMGVTADDATYENRRGGMVDPGATQDFPVIREDTPTPLEEGQSAKQPVHFTWINDYGADAPAQAPLGGGV